MTNLKDKEKNRGATSNCHNLTVQVKQMLYGRFCGIPRKRTMPTHDKPDLPAKSPKHKHGEYAHVLLTSDEYLKLCEEWGEPELLRMIKTLDEGIETKGYKYKNHNLALRKWKSNENNQRNGYSKPLPVQTRTTFLDMED